jgi:hypothetical protein
MTIKQLQKIEKMANESMKYARAAIKKNEQLQSFLSVIEYKKGIKNEYSSVDDIFRKIKAS